MVWNGAAAMRCQCSVRTAMHKQFFTWSVSVCVCVCVCVRVHVYVCVLVCVTRVTSCEVICGSTQFLCRISKMTESCTHKTESMHK